MSAAVAVHITPDGRCGQTELFTAGGPLTGSVKAAKVWPGADENLELTISFEDLSSVRWVKNQVNTKWMNSTDTRIAYRWTNHGEDDEILDDQETEDTIGCDGWSVRLNIRTKTAAELRVDMLLIPVKLDSLTEAVSYTHLTLPTKRIV